VSRQTTTTTIAALCKLSSDCAGDRVQKIAERRAQRASKCFGAACSATAMYLDGRYVVITGTRSCAYAYDPDELDDLDTLDDLSYQRFSDSGSQIEDRAMAIAAYLADQIVLCGMYGRIVLTPAERALLDEVREIEVAS